MSAKEMFSTQQCGKTLESWKEYLKKIRDIKVDTYNYVLYINKDFWDKFKDELDFLDGEVEITTNLPKNVNAVFMKKVDWRFQSWYER